MKLKNKQILIGAVLVLAATAGCRSYLVNLGQPIDRTDAIIDAEMKGKKMLCATAEPFLTIKFNFDKSGNGTAPVGNGNVSYTEPSGGGDQTTITTRIPNGQTALNHVTPFRLSNGLEGTMSKTTNQYCEGGQLFGDPPDQYVLKITSFPSGSSSQLLPVYGCCQMQ